MVLTGGFPEAENFQRIIDWRSLLKRVSSFVSDQKAVARELGLLTERMLCFAHPAARHTRA